MKKSVKVTTAALCALMLSTPLAIPIGAQENQAYISSGESISENALNLSFSGNSYLDLSERAYTGVRVILDGKDIVSTKARIIDSVTYVPLRAF